MQSLLADRHSHAHAPSLQGEMLRAMVPSSMFVVPEGRDAGRGHAEGIPALDIQVCVAEALCGARGPF